MSFINAFLLGGALAAVAPLIIHLLNRTRVRTIPWAAMHLLDDQELPPTRRIHWQSLLLLLIRCSIPVLLALSLARPLIPQGFFDNPTWFTRAAEVTAVSDSRQAIVMLIDDSFSMQASSGEDSSRFEVAIQQAEQVLDHYRGRADFHVRLVGGGVRELLPGFTGDVDQLRRTLRNTVPLAGGLISDGANQAKVPRSDAARESKRSVAAGRSASVPHAGLLADAIGLAARQQVALSQVILISDFQRSDWSRAYLAGAKNVESDWLSRLKANSDGTSVRLSLIGVEASEVGSPPPNLALQVDVSETERVLAGETFEAKLTVSSIGFGPLEDLPVIFEVDDQPLFKKSVSLQADDRQQIYFQTRFTKSGWHKLAWSFESQSPRVKQQRVTSDDSVSAILRVDQPPRLLAVERDPALPKLRQESGFIQLALSPFRQDDAEKRTLNRFDIDVVAASDLVEQLRDRLHSESQRSVAAVLLPASVPLPDQAWQTLYEFVVAGGGLMIFPGTADNAVRLPDERIMDGEKGVASGVLVPFQYASRHSVDTPQALGMIAEGIDLPALNLFQSSESTDLSSLRFEQWYDFSSPTPSGSKVMPVFFLSNQQPWSVLAKVGEGRVLQFAVALGDATSNLPSQPVFVPLMQSLTNVILNEGRTRWNISVGETAVMRGSSSRKQTHTEAAVDSLAMVDPAGQIRPLMSRKLDPNPSRAKAEDMADRTDDADAGRDDGRAEQDIWISQNLAYPGVYRIVHPGLPEQRDLGNSNELRPRENLDGNTSPSQRSYAQLTSHPTMFRPPMLAVQAADGESLLETMSPDELQKLAAQVGGTAFTAAEELFEEERIRQRGREYWRLVLWCVIGLLMAELLLQRFVARGGA